MTIRVILVDDHPIIRQSLLSVLNQDPGIEVIGTGSNGQEALELVDRLSPDVMVLDYQLPDCNGYEILKQVKAKNLDVKSPDSQRSYRLRICAGDAGRRRRWLPDQG